MASLLVETSVGARLSDNLLNHAQIIYAVGPQVPGGAQHRARFGLQLDPDLAQLIPRSALLRDVVAAAMVPRLLVIASDDPRVEGLHRALDQPRLPVLGGFVVARVGRATLRLWAADLALVWRACEHLYLTHYRDYWSSRASAMASLAQQVDDRLRFADLPRKLAHLTGREPPHADLEVYLLDTDALLSYADDREHICVSTALLSHFERFVYVFAHECARIYLHNPGWWEVEPCAGICAGLPGELLDAVETCIAHYLAATVALHFGPDPGFWMVHPRVEEVIARRWPAFVAAPERGIDLLLEQVFEELRGADPRGAAVHPLRLSVTYDEAGTPRGCIMSPGRF
jgi:hypothetical protein